MKFKEIIASIVALILASFYVIAYDTAPSPGWAALKTESPDILVVFTGEPVSHPSGAKVSPLEFCYNVGAGPLLKGTNNFRSAQLLTERELKRFQVYLVFGHFKNGRLNALERYRVVPLAPGFDLGSIKGKTSEQQFQILLQSGIKAVNQKIQDDETEKSRMEQALQQ